ncbi:uncharacterized protein BDV14DRAFT_203645 [Aspergillus stella-maris]|uniref:uncharacterized protein n=1 Tax=Aspergillus stella-maris TaxID=1810926 RepID=UPI003CCE1ED6
MNFLSLPPEVRLQIYALLLDPNTYNASYNTMRRLTDEAYKDANTIDLTPSALLPRFHITRSTPSILLLNKQITSEALPVLYGTPLALIGPPSTYFVLRQMDIAEFICETLLQRMRVVVLKLEHPEKLFVLSLLDIWGSGFALEKLVVYLPRSEARARDQRRWSVVESRLQTFADAGRIPFEMKEVKSPLEDS